MHIECIHSIHHTQLDYNRSSNDFNRQCNLHTIKSKRVKLGDNLVEQNGQKNPKAVLLHYGSRFEIMSVTFFYVHTFFCLQI